MGTIVVGYVPKPEGDAALDKAIEEAVLRQAKIVVVNSHRGGDRFDDKASVEVRDAMGAVQDKLAGAGVEFEIRSLVRGYEPSEDLVAMAEANNAELIIIGLRRRSPVGKLILGSNAQRILLDAKCPVLSVKA